MSSRSRTQHSYSDFQQDQNNQQNHTPQAEGLDQKGEEDQNSDAEGSVDHSLHRASLPQGNLEDQSHHQIQQDIQSGSASASANNSSSSEEEEEDEDEDDEEEEEEQENHQVDLQPINPARRRIRLKLPVAAQTSETQDSEEDSTMTRRTSTRNLARGSGSPDLNSTFSTNGNGNRTGRVTRNRSRTAAVEQHDDQGGGDEEGEGLNDTQRSEDPLLLQDDQQDARAEEDEDEDEDENEKPARRHTRSGRAIKSYVEPEDEEEDLPRGPKRSGTRHSSRAKSSALEGFVEEDEEDESDAPYGSSRNKRKVTRGVPNRAAALAKRKQSARNRSGRHREDDYEDLGEGEETPDEEIELEGSDFEEEHSGKRKLRQRKRVDYTLFPAPGEPARDKFGRLKKGKTVQEDWESTNDDALGKRKPFSLPVPGGSNRAGRDGWNGLPMSMTGRDLAAAFGEAAGDDSSDDDIPRARRNGVASNAAGGGGGAALLGGAGNVAGAGGGSADALGRIRTGRDPLADVDPLGVDSRVSFDSVGGLDGHISQLKEMVALPLLYPELFQRFGVTPPRGVLFHGPPGTGKTLVARALASSCSPPKQDSSEGGIGTNPANGVTTSSTSASAQAGTSANGAASEATKSTSEAPSGGNSSTGEISFFMRKGADCLSKWVGEAERQLRLLFDEARACQPSIIFFDEIDGLAPVRSAKQDQIHASIVSTLLALMDGLDPRGQVVVIGATNRPDAIDPALRRPGRFDREFYFPLPDMEARRKIIQINTKKWDPPLEDSFLDRLAEVTKGYGGADIRALCTEAALSAIQRRYPQIYSTNERLLLNPESISVDAKDFMMSVSKLVPSSARSTSSPASPLPEHFKPLLEETVARAIAALNRVLPASAKRNALEEALWEDEPSHAAASSSTLPEDGGFGREMLLQSFESLRVFRPRLLIHGRPGMGQTFVGSALLQHLEGYHVQALDLGSLLGDSARTAEAAVVQLFQEAKRHRPSIIFIPGLAHWAHALSESTKATVKALLDGLSPSDPILLLGVSETSASKLPADVRSWFGYVRENRIDVPSPTESQRRSFFQDLMDHAARPPVDFPDALPRRKKVLEKLPIAPARPPRAPTAAELQAQEEADRRTLELLKYRLGPVLADLRKKYRRFTRDVWEEYNLIELTRQFDSRREKGKVIVTLRYDKPASAVRRRHSSLDRVEKPAQPIAAPTGAVSSHSAIETQQGSGDVQMQDGEGSGPEQMQMQMQMQTQEQVEPNGASISTPVAQIGGFPEEDQAPPSSAPAALNGQVNHSAESAPQSQDPSVVDLTKTVDGDDEYELRDLVIHTMTLDKMQKRLYHNGYLTPAAFLADITKMVENAEAAQEVDAERLFRANAMKNYATILTDSYVQEDFRIECERMASRQEAREAKEKEQEDKMKPNVNTSASSSASNLAPRQSARVQGKAPEYKQPVNIGALERKRSRRGSSEPKESDSNKRSRVEGPANPSPLGLNTPILPGRLGSPSPSSSQDQQRGLEAPQTTGPAPDAEGGDRGQATAHAHVDGMQVDDLLNPSTSASTSESMNGHVRRETPPQAEDVSSVAPEIAVRSGTETPQKESTPPPPPPPFVINQSQLFKLQSHILQKTSSFNTEQLEQLRATCFAAVWRRRGEYNRDALLKEMWEITDDISCAVEDERREIEELEERENGY